VRGFFNGIVFTVALLVAAAYFAVRLGVLPAGADVKPSGLERWAAHTSLDATIDRETKNLTNPLQPTDANLIDGVHLYGKNCATCQLAKHGVEDDDESETYWKIEHGIRFSAMPSFASTLADTDAWKVAMFLKRMDALPPAVEAEWKKVPSVAPSGGK
jgi:mono/diheme cytochrome c family protein